MLKFRTLIADTVTEFQRMNNFCRIYPARNSKLYDRFFSMSKQLSKVVYRVLHTPEIIPYGIVSNQQVPNVTSPKMNPSAVTLPARANQPGRANSPPERTGTASHSKKLPKSQDDHSKQTATTDKRTNDETSELPSMQDSSQSNKNTSVMKNSSLGAAGSTQASSELKSQTNKSLQSKIMITGDDILIEYVARLVKQLSQTSNDAIKPVQLT